MKIVSPSSKVVFTLAVPDKTGASRMALAYAQAFVRRDASVTVLHGAPPACDEGDDGIIPEMSRFGIKTQCMDGFACPWRPSSFNTITCAVKRIGGNVVIGINQKDRPLALTAAYRLGIPGIVSGQNQHRFYGPIWMRWLKRQRYGWYIKHRMDLAICSSGEVLKEFRKGFGVRADRLAELPNAISVAKFGRVDPSEATRVRAELNVGPSAKMLVSVGRLDTQKGYDLLIPAFAQLPFELRTQCHLVIVGGVTHSPTSRAYAGELRRKIRMLGVEKNVTLAGWRDDVPRILGAADYYVHSARWEGLPLAALEGMASGLPAMITDCSGYIEGFEIGTHGEIVYANSQGALVAGLTQLLTQKSYSLNVAGRECRRLIKSKYSIEYTGERFVDMVFELVRQKAIGR